MKNIKYITLIKRISFLMLSVLFIFSSTQLMAMSAEELSRKLGKSETMFYREFFENIFYRPFVRLLRFDKVVEDIKPGTPPALDVNPYDEVPDSSFFVNRHGKDRLSSQELKTGAAQGTSPDESGPWTVVKGKMEGVSVGLFIQDQKGERYLLKFDPKDYPEMLTSAEVISSRFFHAFGYYVPEYHLVEFNPDILKIDPKATYYNEDGFKELITEEALANIVERIPKRKGGVVRASASKIIPNVTGYTKFEGRRKKDPQDIIPHEDRRSIRGMRVFGSWLNHYDLREGNTLDVIEEENGEAFVKHYLFDFGSTLGSAAYRPKVPAAGYEHVVDWYEVGKATPTLKVTDKAWEKRWDALHRQIQSPALGYFDNAQFLPSQWKTQLPYDVFYRLTRSDAFWATKIIMSFTDEDIRAIVETGEYSDSEDAESLSNILTERREIIGRYWFSEVTPLDHIQVTGSGDSPEIAFEDLNLKYGFAKEEETSYRYRLAPIGLSGSDQNQSWQEFRGDSLSLNVPAGTARVRLVIEAKYGPEKHWSHPLEVVLSKPSQGAAFTVAEIDHDL